MKKCQILFAVFVFFAAVLFFPSSVKADSMASSIWGVGVQIGYAELGANQGVSPNTLVQSLAYARALAKQTGCISPDELESLREQMSKTRDSRTLYQKITAYRLRLPSEIRKNCHCVDDNKTALALYGLGVQIGYSELASFLGIPVNTLLRSLGSALDHARLISCVDTKKIEDLIAAMRKTNDSRMLYQTISSYRQRGLYAEVQRDCECKSLNGLWSSADWGQIMIKSSGDTYSGTYSDTFLKPRLGNFRFSNIGNGTYKGTWNDPDGKHKGNLDKVEVSADGNTITVIWSATDGRNLRNQRSTWTRKRP